MNDNRQWGYDDVNGIVIGGDGVSWCVAYDERPQSDKKYADTNDDAIEAGRRLITQLKAEYCGFPTYLYPDATKWTVRIYYD